MKISKTLIAICLLFVAFGFAQNKLKGKVVDFKNKPVAKAKIYLDSIYSKVETNKEGDFEVQLPEKVSTINVVSDEYGLLSSPFNKETSMNFIFLETEKSKKIKKGSKISVVYSKSDQKYKVINTTNLDYANDKNIQIYNNIYDMIRGKIAGVSVSNTNQILIRGVNSVNSGLDPLLVVDGGIVTTLDYINPKDVKKISVLKGAEAAIYGSQGANGVIIVTTK
ncbi:TonB-dependent receptor plug domain-containing protein [Flavobacterium sp.]|uniref:TonB-dependent receptor plug domain-containing protein n=1 Tax=Flavobacterium sp. TaxID=239 RepID=UPI00378FA9C2